jgi:hypothetical protein
LTLNFIHQTLARPLIGLWLGMSRHSWHRSIVANDSPHVHAPGTNPDRVLLAGDGAATGRGVSTHDLGLPGYLARSLTAHTGRATDVDIVVASDMTASKCLVALDGVALDRFDIVVLSLGANEALALTPVDTWVRGLDACWRSSKNRPRKPRPSSSSRFRSSVSTLTSRRPLPELSTGTCNA